MQDDLTQLRLVLQTHQRRAFVASVVDSAIVGTLMWAVSAAVLVVLKSPIAVAFVLAMVAAGVVWRRPVFLNSVASELDRRHGLADLLSSAWAVRDRAEPWAASLRSMANAQAAALPASPWPGRWTIRRSACGLAMAMVALLLTQLMPSNNAQAEMQRLFSPAARSPAPPPLQQTADARQRPADTATSESRLPSEHEATEPGSSSTPSDASATHDTRGPGQADSKEKTAITLSNSADRHDAKPDAIGGNSQTDAAKRGRSAGGIIQSKARQTQSERLRSTEAPPSETSPKHPAGSEPAGYRDLIADFFAR